MYECDEKIIRDKATTRIDVIPEEVAIKLLCQSSFIGDIQRESILRFNDIIQKDGIMYRETGGRNTTRGYRKEKVIYLIGYYKLLYEDKSENIG